VLTWADVARNVRISHAELGRILRRAGIAPDVIEEIKAHVPDPVDVERDAHILERYNLTRGRLMEILGASP
jgi:hypothetical protein